jgi:YHS domain-containing protein
MIRAIIELLVTIFIILFARAVLTGVMRAVTNASSGSPAGRTAGSPRTGSGSSAPHTGGDLHKDPVCGTYVSELTPHRRQNGRETFFYCSEQCKERHALVSR